MIVATETPSQQPRLKAPAGACDCHIHVYDERFALAPTATFSLDSGRCWIKLSAPYETSKTGAPHYDDVSAMARAYVKANPERCLWASNWPHPNQNPAPSSAAMLDLLLDWAGDDSARRRILVNNPAELYGFETV